VPGQTKKEKKKNTHQKKKKGKIIREEMPSQLDGREETSLSKEGANNIICVSKGSKSAGW